MLNEATIARNQSKIIFGVDDNAANLSLLDHTLSAVGYSFIGFSGGVECISMLCRCKPKVILLDIQMPNLDGFEVCQRIRSLAEGRDIPIAFLTGRKTREDVQRCVKVGGNDFILKPFDAERLVERVAYWTQRKI